MTDAQKKAKAKYVSEKVSRIEIRFYPKDDALLAYAKSLGSSGIKALLEREMLSKTGVKER